MFTFCMSISKSLLKTESLLIRNQKQTTNQTMVFGRYLVIDLFSESSKKLNCTSESSSVFQENVMKQSAYMSYVFADSTHSVLLVK